MSAADIAVGMMDSAYFTSRNELLQFFNTTFNLNLTKIEQTASGAVACQLTEYLFPNSIPMSKVNWSAKSSHEYVANYKLLQKAFTKNKVQRFVDVDKLIRGKYQDNLEFCQWLKAFFDQQIGAACGREDYDPVAVRARGKGGKTVPSNKPGSNNAVAARGSSSSRSNASAVGKPRIGVTSSSSSAAATTSSRSPRRVQNSSSAATGSTTSSSTRTARPARERVTQKENNITNNLPSAAASRKPTSTTTSTTTAGAASSATIQKYKEEIKVLKSQNTELQTQISELQIVNTKYDMDMKEIESERDFYFEKLRGIEVMLQVYKEKEERGELLENGGDDTKKVIDKIFKVMYAAMEDNVVVDDEGNLIGDITQDESVLRSNLSLDDLRPQAQDEMIITGEDAANDEDTDELLVSPPSENVDSSAMNDFVPVAIAPAEESDDDDDELLTSGIVSPVNDNEEMLTTDNHVEIGNVDASAIPPESDDDDDDELLTSGIDSGDEGEEAVVEGDDADAAARRSAENARVISQLVGDNDDDISDEDLLVEDGDEASQDEY